MRIHRKFGRYVEERGISTLREALESRYRRGLDCRELSIRPREGQGRLDLLSMELEEADLRGSTFRCVDLSGSSLQRALLDDCTFHDVVMHDVDLRWASVSGVELAQISYDAATQWPAATAMLQADWRWADLPEDLVIDLMRFDAENCVDGKRAFELWGSEGQCPFMGGGFARAAKFAEDRHLWKSRTGRQTTRRPPSALSLVMRLFEATKIVRE